MTLKEEYCYLIPYDFSCLFISLFLLAYFHRQLLIINDKNKNQRNPRKKIVLSQIIVRLSYLELSAVVMTMIISIALHMVACFVKGAEFGNSTTRTLQFFVSVAWCTSKASLWTLLLKRLTQVFAQSTFAISRRTYKILLGCIFIVPTISVITWTAYLITQIEPLFFVIFIIITLFDIIFSFSVQYMFFSKLSQVLKLFVNSTTIFNKHAVANVRRGTSNSSNTTENSNPSNGSGVSGASDGVSDGASDGINGSDNNNNTNNITPASAENSVMADIDSDIEITRTSTDFEIDSDVNVSYDHDGPDSNNKSDIPSVNTSDPESTGQGDGSSIPADHGHESNNGKNNLSVALSSSSVASSGTVTPRKNKLKNKSIERRQEIQFIQIITKFTVLSMNMVITSFLVLFLFGSGVNSNAAIAVVHADQVASAFAVVFYYHFAVVWYNKVCGCCGRCIYKCCDCCIDKTLEKSAIKALYK